MFMGSRFKVQGSTKKWVQGSRFNENVFRLKTATLNVEL